MENYKKPIIISVSVAAFAIVGLFIKNYIKQSLLKPLSREDVIKIYKKFRKHHYVSLKQLALIAGQLATQFKNITPDMIKGYLEGPESPFKISQMIEKNIAKVCQANNITVQQFHFNLNHYKSDPELQRLVQLSEKQFETAMTGRVPSFPVQIPQFLTKQKLLQIQLKVIQQKYISQITIFRKFSKHTQQQLAENPDLLNGLPNQQNQQQLLEEQGLGENDQPASAVLYAALTKYKSDQNFFQSLQNIENQFKKIYSKYEMKINSLKITEDELTELEDELIYFRSV